MRIVTVLSALLLAGLMLGAGSARAVVIVFGEGLAPECYATAEFGDPDKAFDTCTAALEEKTLLARDRAATFVNRSVVRLRVRDYVGAMDDSTASIALEPMSEAYVNRGAALMGLDRAKDAVQDFNKAIAMGLDKLQLAYYDRGLAKEQLKDIPGAYADYKKALQIDPTYSNAADELTRFKVINGIMTMMERS